MIRESSKKQSEMSKLAQKIEKDIFATNNDLSVMQESLEKKLYDTEVYAELFEQNEELANRIKQLEADLANKDKKISELLITVKAVRKLVT